MYSATTFAASDRAVAGRTSSRARFLHWWARPHAFTVLFLTPLFIICALLPDEVFLSWKHAQNFVSPEALATGLTVKELVVRKQLLQGKDLEEVLDLRAMTELGVPGGKGLPGGG
jgi:hypothetical protein